MKQKLEDYGIFLDHIPLRCDSTSILHFKTKHNEVRHHFIWDHIAKGDCIMEYVNTNNQLANIFTKPLLRDKFYGIRSLRILDES